jgi:hypothetical protein
LLALVAPEKPTEKKILDTTPIAPLPPLTALITSPASVVTTPSSKR